MAATVRHRADRGAMSLEFLLVISMLMLVFLLMLQYAVKAHAERVASAAADEALAAASAYDGSAADGEEAGRQVLADIGPRLSNAQVVVTRDGTTATVTIIGEVDQLVPFLPVRVSVEVEGPVEKFVESR
jgi:Flp pilus assembly protein TadG